MGAVYPLAYGLLKACGPSVEPGCRSTAALEKFRVGILSCHSWIKDPSRSDPPEPPAARVGGHEKQARHEKQQERIVYQPAEYAENALHLAAHTRKVQAARRGR